MNTKKRKKKERNATKLSSVPWAYPSFLNITQMSPKILDKRKEKKEMNAKRK